MGTQLINMDSSIYFVFVTLIASSVCGRVISRQSHAQSIARSQIQPRPPVYGQLKPLAILEWQPRPPSNYRFQPQAPVQLEQQPQPQSCEQPHHYPAAVDFGYLNNTRPAEKRELPPLEIFEQTPPAPPLRYPGPQHRLRGPPLPILVESLIGARRPIRWLDFGPKTHSHWSAAKLNDNM